MRCACSGVSRGFLGFGLGSLAVFLFLILIGLVGRGGILAGVGLFLAAAFFRFLVGFFEGGCFGGRAGYGLLVEDLIYEFLSLRQIDFFESKGFGCLLEFSVGHGI